DAENDDEKIEASTEEELASLKKELVEDVEKKQREILYNVTKNKTVKTILMLVVFLYHLFFILSKQQATPGQRIFNLVVVRMDGGTVTFKDALNRVTLLLLLDILAIFCIFSKNRFTVYDYLSKTAVIEVK
ncbi:MAG: RDD family protein, partial [Rickettsiales bacterium]|nr:RDD family protein [Rickettsiales bacterium]